MGTFFHLIAAYLMARNQRLRRANSHVRQMRLGNLHIDRNAISPECIYRFLCICESNRKSCENGKCVCVALSLLLLLLYSESIWAERNANAIAWYLLEFILCAKCARRFVFGIWTILDIIATEMSVNEKWCSSYVVDAVPCSCSLHTVYVHWNLKIVQKFTAHTNTQTHTLGQKHNLIVPPLRWNARSIGALKFIWMANGASGRIFAFVFIIRIGIDVTVECGRQHFRWCYNVCTSLQNSFRVKKKEKKNEIVAMNTTALCKNKKLSWL